MVKFSGDIDPSLDLFGIKKEKELLDYLFNPRNIAVIGASEKTGSVGWTLVWNLSKANFSGEIFPVNPKHETLLGLKCFASVSKIPNKIDLAIIATPAKYTLQVIEECTTCHIPIAVIISGGFKERGEEGAKLEKQIVEIARKGGMRIVGPNCLGVINSYTGLNATFAAEMPHKGHLAFISQSGALGSAILDWSRIANIGLSSFVSIGSMADLAWGDLLSYFGKDDNTHSIFIYMESIGNARSFLSAARKVSLTKPIILIKGGKTEASAKAAASHTGALASSNDVFNIALKRSSIVRVDTIADFFNMAQLTAKQSRPNRPNLAIVTNAGGPAVMATDALVENKGSLSHLSEESIIALNSILPAFWSHGNPIDILGDADSTRYAKTVEIISKDDNFDGILVILTPQHMTDAKAIAQELSPFAKIKNKTVLASFMGGELVESGRGILNDEHIPHFEYPDAACKAFCYLWETTSQKELYETSYYNIEKEEILKRRGQAATLLTQVHSDGRTLLTEYESKQLLNFYEIPTVTTYLANTAEEAVSLAEKLSYPIVLKLNSKTITHKSDVGGVKLNLKNADEIRTAFNDIKISVSDKVGAEHFNGVSVQPMARFEGYELILGSYIDPEFGPILLFGSGGYLVEIFKDRALCLPPLTASLAKRFMERTKIYTALKGVRGRKEVDLEALGELMVRFSHLITEQNMIKELDINPLSISPDNMVALDARVVLYNKGEERKQLALYTYPLTYSRILELENNKILIRAIRPEDTKNVEIFYKMLAEHPYVQNYLKLLNREVIDPKKLIDLCYNDYTREIVFIAEDSSHNIIGMVKLKRPSSISNEGSFAILLHHNWRHKGIGKALLEQILKLAADENIKRVSVKVLPENEEMQNILKNLGFSLNQEENFIIARKEL